MERQGAGLLEVNRHTFPNGKEYLYVRRQGGQQGQEEQEEQEHEGPIFMRNILFLTHPQKPHAIVLVRSWGAKRNAGAWEPPKGQMEWSDFAAKHIQPGSHITPRQLYQHARDGVLREMVEEAKIMPSEIKHLKLLPMCYTQEWPESGVPKAAFQYQFWHAVASNHAVQNAQARMAEFVGNPEVRNSVTHDHLEKDGVMWWSPRDGWAVIRGGFSEKMTRLYFKTMTTYGL